MTALIVPSAYKLYPALSTTLWCLLTGRKMCLSSLQVREEIPIVAGSGTLTVSTEDPEFEVARYALHTAKLSRKECLSVLRNGGIRLPAKRVELTIPLVPTKMRIEVGGAGGGGGGTSPEPEVDEDGSVITHSTTTGSGEYAREPYFTVPPHDFGPYSHVIPDDTTDDEADCW